MRVRSFIRQGGELMPVEVELSLQPGLPQIHFLGLPDAALRESALRIRSALRSQGFHLPQGSQILVDLRPSHLRKSSRGLDLAVAAALLWEMNQVPLPSLEETPTVYGALSLTGEVEVPDDIERAPLNSQDIVITGWDERSRPFATVRLRSLADFSALPGVSVAQKRKPLERPEASAITYPLSVARLAEVVASGEHSLLVAGPPGSGKSTLVDSIVAWLEEPQGPRRAGQPDSEWRPVVRPHHSITPLAMIGGGNQLWPGEITRADGGVLIMDELLEFDRDIQESLREPMESGVITLARGGRTRTFPAQFQILATTNLCECGQYTPGARAQDRCRCSRIQRRRSMARLTGPFADRFQILAYSDGWLYTSSRARRESPPVLVPASEIAERVARAICFRKDVREESLPNSRADVAEIEASLSAFQRALLDEALEGSASLRRRHACLRLARTLADLRQSERIGSQDIDAALALGKHGHQLLEEWRE